MEMEWLNFEPVFFLEGKKDGDPGLALLPTLGWKAQAALGDQGIGFLQKGYRRVMAKGEREICEATKELYRE
jgi:hypothetical protein